jgi:hypothetical protein
MAVLSRVPSSRLINRRITDMQSLQHLDLLFRAQSDIRPNQAVNQSEITGLEGNGGPPNSTASPSLQCSRSMCAGEPAMSIGAL